MISLGAALARTLVISANFAACWARRKKAIASLFSTWLRKWPIARSTNESQAVIPSKRFLWLAGLHKECGRFCRFCSELLAVFSHIGQSTTRNGILHQGPAPAYSWRDFDCRILYVASCSLVLLLKDCTTNPLSPRLAKNVSPALNGVHFDHRQALSHAMMYALPSEA